MPAGYEAVSEAFGVRAGGLAHEGGVYVMPVVEFRTGDDYALYPIATQCDGNFARGPGTVFASDGTVKENIQQQSPQPVSASPQFAPVIDRICRDARASRFVPDPFKPQEALALLFGPPDVRGEVQWNHDGSDGLEAGSMRVSLRKSGQFTQGRERWAYILTGSRNPQCEGNACGRGAIGAALFRFDGGKWVLVSHNPVVIIAGRFGNATGAEDIKDLQPDGKWPLISVLSGDCDTEVCSMQTTLLSVVDDRFADTWTGQVSYTSQTCLEDGPCNDWASQIKTIPVSGRELPDIQVTTTGTRWDEASGKLFRLNEKATYRFDPAGKYHEISRTGEPVEIPVPRREQEAENAEEQADASEPSFVDRIPAHAGDQGPPAVPDSGASVDASSRSMNPPRYPGEEYRRGIEGTTVLVVSIDASGGVLDVEVQTSSGNSNLDRAAMQAARKWRFNPAVENGQKIASRVSVPVSFSR